MIDQIVALAAASKDQLIAALLVPLVIALLNRPNTPKWLKGLVALGASLVASFLVLLLNGSLSTDNIQMSLLLILGGATVAYKWFWKGTDITDIIEKFDVVAWVKKLLGRDRTKVIDAGADEVDDVSVTEVPMTDGLPIAGTPPKEN